ncbi:MAG TPA: alcohol dehydrogenase, partial [Candidatus Latescibacteria bacterium]|nr:alcohol dehydrogenase [Candidatus Latescibacterota bacterium]
FEIYPLREGEILARLEAIGICSSDVYMWRGKDPRTPLPIILGHEGVGTIEEIYGKKTDILGRDLTVGDRIIWDRGITCGLCYYCAIRKEPSLCPNRQVYGISFSCQDPPYPRGCYANYIHLSSNTKILRLDEDVDPVTLVSASCSGATAAHTIELCKIKEGDRVVIQGPGPLGIFSLAFALSRGASVVVIGTGRGKERLRLCTEFGARETLNTADSIPEERRHRVMELTDGLGADVVINCTSSPEALKEGITYLSRGGTYALPGLAIPVGPVSLDLYHDVVSKNIRIQGVWVNDTSHLYQAVNLILNNRYPFEKLVTHEIPLHDASKALEIVEGRKAVKAVMRP